MYPSIDKIKQILLSENYITEEDDRAAQATAKDSAGYISYLMTQELLSKPLLGQALAEAAGVPYADLEAHPPTKEVVTMLPEQLARTSRLLLVEVDKQRAVVATDNPEKFNPKQVEALVEGRKIQLAYALPEHIDEGLRLYEQPLETRFSQIIASGTRVAPEIVDEIISDALKFRASDIHFEPTPGDVVVRFRVDGSLREAGKVPKEYYENILNRIKVESGMRIDEHMSAQDGAIQRQDEQATTDLRVSLVPTVEGEKVVMRVISSYVQGISLTDIGFDDKQWGIVEAYARKPFGMILTVGPTGSGKTTTLYALLKMLDQPSVNITTIEDPVEYKMPHVNQIQVRSQSNLTFAKGLRAIVRQDPDIILVGEIRDHETAEISVNAALTGHLLLSTFHSNDAATAIPRLIDMGVEPFLLASTLELIIAQRLVRKICTQCRYSLPAATALAGLKVKGVERYFSKADHVYAGKGCAACNGTGYLGRAALFEIIEVTDQMESLILTSPSTKDIAALARKQGSLAMFEDGIDKVKRGVTSIEEVVRVVEPPSV